MGDLLEPVALRVALIDVQHDGGFGRVDAALQRAPARGRCRKVHAVIEENLCDALKLGGIEEPVAAVAGCGKVERRPSLRRVRQEGPAVIEGEGCLAVDVRAVIEQPLRDQQGTVTHRLMEHRHAVGLGDLR